jgi:hypothetical protein
MQVMNAPAGPIRALRDRFLQFRDRERTLDAPRFEARVHAGARVVHVRVEEAGHHGPTSEIDHARCATELTKLPDAVDPTVLDRQSRCLPGRVRRRTCRSRAGDQLQLWPRLADAATAVVSTSPPPNARGRTGHRAL